MPAMSQRRHYAGTTVPESQSLLDIEFMLRRHGTETVRWTTGMDLIRIEFIWPYKGAKLGFRIDLDIPAALDGYSLNPKQRDQERRRRLRVLLNHIKAKLIAVEDGLVDMEQEFLPYLIGPGGRTVGEVAVQELGLALERGDLPDVHLLPPGAGP